MKHVSRELSRKILQNRQKSNLGLTLVQFGVKMDQKYKPLEPIFYTLLKVV